MVRRQERKRILLAQTLMLPMPSAPNQNWSMDYVADILIDGRKLQALTSVDDFTRGVPGDRSGHLVGGLSCCRGARAAAHLRGLPVSITVDHNLRSGARQGTRRHNELPRCPSLGIDGR